MKRRRGLRQKCFPIPHTCAEGILIACYGQTGGSEAMQLLAREEVHDWPHPSGSTAESRLAAFRKKRTAEGGKPFGELAQAEKALSSPPEPDVRRLLAMELRAACFRFAGDPDAQPFSRKLLREWYRRRRPGNNISSSTLTRLFRWANNVDSLL